jgi:hypothetical protein
VVTSLTEAQATEIALALADLGYESGFAAVRTADGQPVPDAFAVDFIRPFSQGF